MMIVMRVPGVCARSLNTTLGLQTLAHHSPESGVLKGACSPQWSTPVHILSLHSHRVGCAVLEEGQTEGQALSRCHGSDRPIGQCDSVREVRSVLSVVQ